MFGLLQHKNLNQENYFSFRQNYCGTCKTIGKLYGQKERLLLNNDVVFLSELLAEIKNCQEDFSHIKINSCFSLPKNQESIPNFLKYCASVNILLAYHKIVDNIEDSKYSINIFQVIKTVETSSFKKAEKYLNKSGLDTNVIKNQVRNQFLREKCNVYFPDFKQTIKFYSEITGAITGDVFRASASIIEKKHLSDLLFKIGEKYGEVVYLIDAFEDYKKDERNGNFNIICLRQNITIEEMKQEIIKYLNSNILIIKRTINDLPISMNKKIDFCNRVDESISKIVKPNISTHAKKFKAKAFIPFKDRFEYAIAKAKNISTKKKWSLIKKMSFYSSAAILIIIFLCFPLSMKAGNSNHFLDTNCCNDCDGCCGKACCDKEPRSDYGEGTKEECGKFKDTFCTSSFCLSCCAIVGISQLCGCNASGCNSDKTKVITVTKIIEVDKGCGCK